MFYSPNIISVIPILIRVISFSSLSSSSDFCHLLITFAKSLDPNQTLQFFQPNLDSYCLQFFDILIIPEKIL